MRESLLDYLVKNNFIILPNSYKSLELNQEMTVEQEYTLYEMLVKHKYINLLGILPDNCFKNDDEIIDYLVNENLFYKEEMNSIIYENKIEEIVKTYNFHNKIYFKYININIEKVDIEKLIKEYKED